MVILHKKARHFLALKEKGNSHLGLSFEKDNDKKVIDKWKEAKITMNYKKEREKKENSLY